MVRAVILLVCSASLATLTSGQARILTSPQNDPLKCFTADHVVGDCRPWRYCRVVRQQYPKKKPTICFYRPKNPIVCCPRKSSGQFITTSKPAGRPRPAAIHRPQTSGPRPAANHRPQTSGPRPATNPWRPIAGPRPAAGRPVRPQQANQTHQGQYGQFVLTAKPGGGSGARRPAPATPAPATPAPAPSSGRLQLRGNIGHRDCGIVSPTVRADFDQLELRRRRRRATLDRSHASAPANPFDFYDSLVFGEEEQETAYKPYTEPPPPAPATEVSTGAGIETETGVEGGTGAGTDPGSGGQQKVTRIRFLPPEPGAASLVFGDVEEGYTPDFEITPDMFNETFVMRTGKKVADPYHILSQEYMDRVSEQLKDVQYITGGEDAVIGRWPWMALIGERLRTEILWFCGGAILNERFVVTAAHCLGQFQKSRLVVRVGEFDLASDTDSPHQDLLVNRIYLHPQYRHQRKHHDIALLRLSRPLRLNALVRPVCLQARRAELTGQLVSVAGWGHRQFGGEKSDVLQEVQLPLVNTTVCERKYRTLGGSFQSDFAPGFGDTKICAHDTSGAGKDSCQGDSGGPMTYLDPVSERVQLVGIVSSGVGCGHPEFPGVYTRVAMYVDWILEKAFQAR